MLTDRPGVLVGQHNCALTLEAKCHLVLKSHTISSTLSVFGIGACQTEHKWFRGRKVSWQMGPRNAPEITPCNRCNTRDLLCEAGKRPPLRGTRERDRQQDRYRDREAQAESRLLGQELFEGCMCCIWWLIMSPWRQTGRSPGS